MPDADSTDNVGNIIEGDCDDLHTLRRPDGSERFEDLVDDKADTTSWAALSQLWRDP
jgi:hypothetical protein